MPPHQPNLYLITSIDLNPSQGGDSHELLVGKVAHALVEEMEEKAVTGSEGMETIDDDMTLV